MMKIYKETVNLFRLYWIENKRIIILFPVLIFVLYVFMQFFLTGSIGQPISTTTYQGGNIQTVETSSNTIGLGIMALWSILFMLIQSRNSILKPINQSYLTLSVSAEAKWIFLFLVTSLLVYFVAFITQLLSIELLDWFIKWYYGDGFVSTHFEKITFKMLVKSIFQVAAMQGVFVTGFLIFKRMPVLKTYLLFSLFSLLLAMVSKYLIIGNDFYQVKLNFHLFDKIFYLVFIVFGTLNYFLLKKRQLK